MSDSHGNELHLSAWDRFWFAPQALGIVSLLRGCFCAITAIYFLSSLPDVADWYGDKSAFSQHNVAEFFAIAELQSETRWILSPLFWIESVLGSKAWVHYLYLIAGVALCAATALGRGGRIVPWVLWIVFVGWANRILFLAGRTETLLSLCLFACAIAPVASAWRAGSNGKKHWLAGFAIRLLSVQVTIYGILMCALMLSQDVWWNGVGSVALAAPVEDRTIDMTGILSTVFIRDVLTHFLVLALPLGLWLAWRNTGESLWPTRVGVGLLIAWSVVVAVLGSHWLFATVFATACLSLSCQRRSG
ncbi:MAG: hypothetical protein WBD20_16430 [Pirellulaceae bacterium]